MTDEEVIKVITDEFQNKTLGATEQYLEIHEPVYSDVQIKIDRIDRETEGLIIAYLPVKNEYFSFVVYIGSIKKEILNVGTESRNLISLVATSETLTSTELMSFTKLTPVKFANNGDFKANKKAKYKWSFVEYEIIPEPDEFENKLKKLLNYLQEDREGVLKLVSNGDYTFINVRMDFHQGNQHLGGVELSAESIKIMAELNLKIIFDFWAWGESFK